MMKFEDQTELRVGDTAPNFTLPCTAGGEVSLSDLRGHTVALVFVPFAFSGICTGELCELRDNFPSFNQAGVQLYGVSCDAPYSQKAWKEAEGYEFDLLSDFWPHGQIARSYGVFDESVGAAVRGSFLIDADGVIRWTVVNPLNQARNLEGYLEALAAL